jgi:serine/threonine protein kinase
LAHEALVDESEFRVSTKRDIYSLGLCILQLATDLWIPSDGEQLEHIRKLELPEKLTSRVPAELSSLVFKMMAEDPKERPEADQILKVEVVNSRNQERVNFVEHRVHKRREKVC